MDFSKLTKEDLLQAYRGYLKLSETGAVGEEDFDGIFRKAIDESDVSIGGKVVTTCQALIAEIAKRWFAEHNQQPEPLSNLIKLVSKYPGLPIVPMVDGEIVSEEGSIRWIGSLGISYVAKVYTGKDRVYFFDDTCREDVLECLTDSDLFWETCDFSEDQALDYYRNLPWKKVVVVNIDLPEKE